MTVEGRPVIGILVGEKNWDSYYIRSLLKTARTLGVQATRLTAGRLRKGELNTLPSVVYNRIPTRREESERNVEAVKNWLNQQRIPYFNARFFNKREVDLALRKTPETADLLPASWHVWDDSKMEKRLDEFGALYLKPIAGSLGEGICRIEKNGGRYRVETRSGAGVLGHDFGGKKEFYSFMHKKLIQHGWIIQEAIPLRTYRGRSTDFRVHVQRRPEGDFVVTGLAAKVAAKGAVTTHVHSGGFVEAGHTVLTDWFHQQAQTAYEAMTEAGLAIARQISAMLDPQLGELGLDMGFSKDGRLIVFEANAKPGRAIFRQISERRANVHSQKLLLQYAVALANKEAFLQIDQGVVS